MENQDKANFALLFEHMLEGFAYCKMLFDEDGKPDDFVYLAVNSAFEKLTGLKGVVGKKVTEVIPNIKNDQPELLTIYGQVALNRQPEKKEIYFKPLNIWLSLSIYSPQKGYFVAVFDNITERKNAEKALGARNEGEQKKIDELENTKKAMLNLLEDARDLQETVKIERDRVTAIISSMGEGLLVIDKNFKVTIINKAAQKLLEVSDLETVGKNWTEIVHAYHGDSETPVGDRSFSKAINEKKTFLTSTEDNHFYKTRLGKKFPVASVTSPLFSGDEVVGAIKVFRDVTHEKEEKARIEAIVKERTQELSEKNIALQKAQEEVTHGWLQLQAEKARLSASINGLPLGFVLIDNADNILIINPALRKILSLSGDITSFEQIDKLFYGSVNLQQMHQECKNLKAGKEIKDINFGSLYLHIFLVPIISTATQAEEYIGTAIVIEDVTETRALDRSKDEFFSIASHELRTPLTAIRGNTSMIMEYFGAELKDENVREMIGDIHESSVRLIGIVNDFLDLSRLEQHRMEFKKEQVDLKTCVGEVLAELQPNAKEGVTLNLNEYANLPNVLADKDKLKEVMINLVGNALKFTEQGSVTVSFNVNNNFVETYIADTGRGIPLGNQSLLFHKFQQAGSSIVTRDTTKGTGLGLYISKLMIEGMAGTIRLATSEEGKGSTFAFSLPSA